MTTQQWKHMSSSTHRETANGTERTVRLFRVISLGVIFCRIGVLGSCGVTKLEKG